MGALDRIKQWVVGAPLERADSLGLDWYLQQLDQFSFNGTPLIPGPRMTWQTNREEPISQEFESIVRQAYKRNGVIFAAILARMLIFSEIRFKYRTLSDKRLFGTEGLARLEKPGPNVTTVELLRRMEQDASLAGNWYGTDKFGGVKRLHPAWMSIILTSELSPSAPGFAEDAEVVGYLYRRGGQEDRSVIFGVDEIAHWSPIPDPDYSFRGMSWITPAVRDVMADNAGTDLRLKYYENGATPNMVINAPDWIDTAEAFDEWRGKVEGVTSGLTNAFRNLYLAAGSDATAVGLNLQQLDFKALQGGGETRIAMDSRVPAVILGVSEGLSGSSLNQGNYNSARRQFADGFLHPQWRDACGCLTKFASPPAGSELWFDKSEVPFLREDEKDAAEIMQIKSGATRQFIEAGFTPESAVSAVSANDERLLVHTGMVSVQLQDPTKQGPPDATPIPVGEVPDE
jgi:phage portal protein BeeE